MNRLADETSPYLRQHADNPVDWYPWGDEAFAAARAADRPSLLSVGYSACHWCHVMAHESFEDPEVAALMNDLFVNVKVDREERPDVDAVYMEAVQATTGQGGWPMTVFLTPDGRPFFGGTYFPKETRHGMISFPDLCRRADPLAAAERQLFDQHAPAGGGFGGAPKFPQAMSLDLLVRLLARGGAGGAPAGAGPAGGGASPPPPASGGIDGPP